MRITLATMLILLLTTCNEEIPANQEEPTLLQRTTDITDNTVIVGSWTMCSSSENGMMIQYNVCPIVIFKSDGTGSVGNEYASREGFKWKFQKGHLDISYGAATSNKTFSDTSYIAGLKIKNNGADLTIRQSQKDCSFYLSR